MKIKRIEHVGVVVRALEKSRRLWADCCGIPLIDQVPRIGHAGCRIADLDPSGTEGYLIELAELPAETSHPS